MSTDTATNRVPAGTPTGGRFAAKGHSESAVTLGGVAPDQIASQNRHQRTAEYNRRWAHLTRHGGAHERRAAARAAVRRVFDTGESFTDVPQTDGHEEYIEAALGDDAKVEQAIADVGALSRDEEQHYGDLLGGALYDLESAAEHEYWATKTLTEPAPPGQPSADEVADAYEPGDPKRWALAELAQTEEHRV